MLNKFTLAPLGTALIRPRAPYIPYSTDRAPPLLSLQMLTSVNIFLEGNEGVKERRLQNDHYSPKFIVSYVY